MHATGGFYADPARGFLKEFGEVLGGAKAMLEPRLGPDGAARFEQDASADFAEQLPRLPEVGGERNPDARFIVVAAWYAALWKAGAPLGLEPADLGRVVYDLNRMTLEQADRQAALAEGAARFTPEALREGRDWAAWTQRREHPGNWVAEFLVGDGQDFDFGYDYTECGVVKHLRSRGMGVVAPYVCLNDFLSSDFQGTGLFRVGTLAMGDARCDFRYKRGRAVVQNWETEAPRIAARL